MNGAIPPLAWLSALVIFALYLLMLAGVSVWRELLAASLWGPLTVGSGLLLLLHVAPVVLGVWYLRSTRGNAEPSAPEGRVGGSDADAA